MAHNRDGETLSETLERLVGTPSLRELAGVLSDDDAEAFREAIEELVWSHKRICFSFPSRYLLGIPIRRRPGREPRFNDPNLTLPRTRKDSSLVGIKREG